MLYYFVQSPQCEMTNVEMYSLKLAVFIWTLGRGGTLEAVVRVFLNNRSITSTLTRG